MLPPWLVVFVQVLCGGGLEERLLAVRFDERRADGVHGSVIDVRLQLDLCDVDADEMIVSAAVVSLELLDERSGLRRVHRRPRTHLIAFDVEGDDVDVHPRPHANGVATSTYLLLLMSVVSNRPSLP